MSIRRNKMTSKLLSRRWFRIMDSKLPLLVQLFGAKSIKKTKKDSITTYTYIKRFRGKNYVWREEIFTNEKNN